LRNKNRMRIRTLEPGDYDFIISRVDEWWGGRRMAGGLPRLFFNHFAGTGLAADDDEGRIAAFVLGFMSPQRPDEAYIHYAAVDPAHHRTGLGRRMYEAFFKAARDHGRTVVRCLTSPVNKLSISFHQGIGFELVDSIHHEDGIPIHLDYDGPGNHRVLFEKRLTTKQVSSQPLPRLNLNGE
jgi:ribosomal protein S18 acetylase RimI-like enzyme